LQPARDLANALGYDAVLLAQDNEADAALASCRAILNDARAIGDEPLLISQLVRVAIRAIAVRKIERVLAQTQPSDAALLATQRTLEQEAEEPLLLYGVRGERASCDGFLQAIQDGYVTMANLRGLMGGPGAAGGLINTQDLNIVMLVTSPRTHRAAFLRYMNELVEICKRSSEEQDAELKALAARIQKRAPFVVRSLAPAHEKVQQAINRTRAELRATTLAMAAERYRRAFGHWPDQLQDLVPMFAEHIPLDPFAHGPMLYHRKPEECVIYSVGLDGVDDGGRIDRSNPTATGYDLGVRLFDVHARRQSSQPLDLREYRSKQK
jgi:hypothetical protein